MALRRMLIGTLILSILLGLFSFPVLQRSEASGGAPIIGTTSTPLAISYPFQRKAFQAHGRVWVFFSDGNNMLFSSSPDGVLWSGPILVRPDCTSGEQFSVWFDGKLVHYVYGSGSAGASLYYRGGTPIADGTITWSSSEQAAVPGRGKVILSTPCISVDSYGCPWIGYRRVEDQGNKRPMLVKSGKGDGTWSTAPGFPYDLAGWTAAAWVVVPVPLSAGKMLALFTSSGHYVRSRVWRDGVWSSQAMNPGPGIGVSSPHFSAAATGDDVHLVFLSSTSLVYTRYCYLTNRWSPEVRPYGPQVTPTSSPVLSLDGSGGLHLFWAGSPKPDWVYSKAMSGGVWESSFVEVLDERGEKLTGNGFIFGLGEGNGDGNIGYLVGRSSPYRIKFYGGSPSLPPFQVKIISPKDGEVFYSSPISVNGELTHRARVWVNGVEVTVTDGHFSASIALQEGENPITVEAEDEWGRKDSKEAKVTLLTEGKISGTVTDSSTGFPVPSAGVEVRDSLDLLHKVNTDGQGRYMIDGVTSGSFSGKVTKDGYTPYPFSGTLSPGQILAVNAALDPILPLIGNVEVLDITMDSARISWETDQPADTRVDYGESPSYGEAASDSAMGTGHEVSLHGLKAGTTYYFKVTSKSAHGFPSASGGHSFITQVLSSPIRLKIIYPPDGGVLYNAWTRVEGEVVNTLGHETGVVVNGVLAQVYGNRFVANHVPLLEGANTITAAAMDGEGNKETASVNVRSVASEGYIKISASSESGVAPLEIVLALESSVDLSNASLSYTGPGEVEFITQSPDEYRVRIPNEGIYQFTARIASWTGVMFEDRVSIAVVSREELHSLLLSKWEGMRGKLGREDIEGALEYFDELSRAGYGEVFNVLSPLLPAVIQEMGDIRFISYTGDTAIYDLRTVRDGVEYSFQLLFSKDRQGIWRIYSF
jgi:hypothetical protein